MDDEIQSNTLEQNIDGVIDVHERRCQSEITIQPNEESQTNTLTTECLSLTELNIENPNLVDDHSDDELLLSNHHMSNHPNSCSRYWLEILMSSGILILIVIILGAGRIFLKDFKESKLSVRGCNKKSETGKSCSIDDFETILLIGSLSASSNGNSTYSKIYTAVSTTTIITFSFEKRTDWNLDNISIRDMLNNDELIEDGGFESGTLYSYCVCDSSFQPTKPQKLNIDGRETNVCKVNAFFSAVQLSQQVNTIPGHNYNVRFWLTGQSSFKDREVTVYMSSVLSIYQDFSTLLLKTIIINFFIIYQ